MYCYSCGKEISDTAKFCKYCGTKMPDLNGIAGDTNSSNQAAQSSRNASAVQNVNIPQISLDNLPVNEDVKNAISTKKCTDSRLNYIFGAGHILLLLLTFLPWYKAGITEYNPYAIISQLVNSISQGRGDMVYFIATALIVSGTVLVVLSSVYGAYMRFIKSYTANIANIVVVGACVIVFAGGFLLVMSSGAAAGGAINPTYGFYLTLVISLALSVLGSGRVDLQKYLNKDNTPK